jgi:hypothetical protein
MTHPEQRNNSEIERLEALLAELRKGVTSGRESDAIREIGLEIAVAIREVGAMFANLGLEQASAGPTAKRADGNPAARGSDP